MSTRRYAIVPAAGNGRRFQSDRPKQYASIAGRSVLAHTLDRLRAVHFETILVALAPDDEIYEEAVGRRTGVEVLRCGGPTRAATVGNALMAIGSRCGPQDWVLVHDATRPCVSVEAIGRLIETLAEHACGGLLAVPVSNTLKRTAGGDNPHVVATEDRSGLWEAQTPQMFRYGLLTAALALDTAHACTDEAQAIEMLAATGRCDMPALVMGSLANVKITYPEDLPLAAAIIAAQASGRAAT